MGTYLIDESVFPDGCSSNTWLFYVPRKNLIVRLNAAAAKELTRAQETGIPPAHSELAELWKRSCSIRHSPTKSLPSSAVPFQPIHVTLFLTNDCQLRCVYCYARAGEHKNTVMPLALAQAAIDFVSKNAVARRQKTIEVVFHGGGEPSSAWGVMTQTTLYAQTQARALGLSIGFSVGTNGILNKEQVEWMARNFKHVTLSLDGPPDIQDANRPLAQGGASHEIVENTIRHFIQSGLAFSVRATITKQSVQRQEEFISYLAGFQKIKNVQFQPMWPSGRGNDSVELVPDHQLFIKHFIRAKRIASQSGMHLFMAGVGDQGLRLDGRYCGASGGTFAVTPQGKISSCYEVVDDQAGNQSPFLYGDFDFESGAFCVDNSKLSHLNMLRSCVRRACADCFCRLTCAGDCPVKVLRQGEYASAEADEHCEVIRALTLHRLQQIINNQQKTEKDSHDVQ